MVMKLKLQKEGQTYLEDENCRRVSRIKIPLKYFSRNELINWQTQIISKLGKYFSLAGKLAQA